MVTRKKSSGNSKLLEHGKNKWAGKWFYPTISDTIYAR